MLVRVVCLAVFLALVSLFMVALPALAETKAPPDTGPTAEIKYFDFFVVKGGPIAFGLIALSIVMIALTIEHCLSIRRATIVPPEAARHTKTLIDEKQYLQFMALIPL